MHLNPLHPQQLVLLGTLTLLAMLFVLAFAAPDLGTLDLSIGGGGEAAPAVPATTASGAPSAGWAADPLPAPVELLRGRS